MVEQIQPAFEVGQKVRYRAGEEGRREGWQYEVLDMQSGLTVSTSQH